MRSLDANSRALVLTYHAIEAGSPPLRVDPALFAEHADRIAACGAAVLTVRELTEHLREGTLPARAVAITFDDGYASVAENAAPILANHGLSATVYCVAGHVGGLSDWPSARPGSFLGRLADADQLRVLAGSGIEIGAHGMAHEPLVTEGPRVLERELVEARDLLAKLVGVEIATYAYPYGAAAPPAARRLVESSYLAACSNTIGIVRPDSDVFALPRVDAHYVRRPELLSRVLAGRLGSYLGARRLGARVRRVARQDYRKVHA